LQGFLSVGAGGEAINTQGTASTSVNNGGQSRFSTITADGGVAPNNTLALGGVSGNGNPGGDTTGQYISGGGGGAGGAGSGTTGGVGVNSNISGSTIMYGSGGAGSSGNTGSASSGGGSNSSPPIANRGGGGSQPASSSGLASAGAAGVVIVRYTTPLNSNPSLSFSANGGSGSILSRSETAGVEIVLPGGSGLSKRNSAFVGWNTLANGSGASYLQGDSFTLLTNTTLFAQWSGPVLAADLASPRCASGVGVGGPNAATVAGTRAGNGCVVAEYTSSGTQAFRSFNYTGDTQTWTVPSGVSSVIFYAIGAGGGGSFPTGAQGGGGGFAKGQLGVNAGDIFSIIVGQGGGGVAPVAEGACFVTNRTFGGGGRGGSCAQNGYSGQAFYQAAGGGRSAIRLSGATEDLITAAGGGGGSYGGQGGAGGGFVGVTGGAPNPGTGGTQIAGGTGGFSVNNIPGFAGRKYTGGDSRDESGGGGGGYWGGGGGGDNGGGGGGSSYLDTRTVTNAVTNAGALTVPGTSTGLFNVITYDGNGFTGGAVPAPTQFTVTGGSRNLETNTAGLVRTGYVLTGWNTQANGRGTSYALASAFSASGDTTLYAQWSYTITYNANGATSGTAPAQQTIIGDSTTTLATNPGVLAITRGVLLGWNTEADGSGIGYPGGKTNFSYDGNVTLYAMWGPATCTPNAGYSNCAVFPMSQQDLFFKLPSNVPVGTIMQAEIWGAGGGVNEGGPTGGGGGGYSRVQIEVQAVGETFTVVTGRGGSRGDIVGTYGGGGATSRNSYWGSSGGGMSGIFSGEGLDNPLVISGGGGGASPGHAVGIAGGGGAAGNPGNQRGNVSDYAIAGAPGTLIAGGAAATNTSQCNGVDATSGSRYQGGRGAGGNTANGTESGGGGGGGYFGGGGGRCQVASGPVQNGGGGGGSGFFDATQVTLLEVVNGENGIAGQGKTGGTTSSQYIADIGLGGGISNSGAAGNGLVVLQWSSSTFTVNYDANTGATTATSITQSAPGARVTIADTSTATKTGFRFLGWNTLANGTGTTIAPGSSYLPPSNVTLFATYAANNYVVIFDSNTATGVSATGSMTNMTIVAGTAKALTNVNFTRTGFAFRNWNSRADGTGTTYLNLANVTFFETTTVYAQWNPILTYVINGGTGTVPVAVNVPPGSSTTVSASTITRSGFTLAGWNTAANRSGTSYTAGETITISAPISLFAMWNLTITFNGNTPTTGSVPSTITTNEYASPILPGNTGNLQKTGLTFVGWNTSSTGGFATRYIPGETITAPATGNLTLWAEWITTCAPVIGYANGDQVLTVTRTTTCAYTLPESATAIDILVVGGGGGGGANVGSGGGGGGVTYRTAVPVTSGQVVIVSNGAGGAAGAVGSASTLTVGKVQFSAGGGALGPTWSSGRTCGSPRPAGGTGTLATGGRGGNGAGATPQAGCVGESGTALSISGTSTIYGAGGGGGGYDGAGGLGGGGVANSGAGNGGRHTPATAGGAGVANTGGGGGGGSAGNASGGAGGDGVTIIALDFLATVTFDTNTAASGAPGTATLSQVQLVRASLHRHKER
jgi:uncharacterized repeat protein (TIGR02543 family)